MSTFDAPPETGYRAFGPCSTNPFPIRYGRLTIDARLTIRDLANILNIDLLDVTAMTPFWYAAGKQNCQNFMIIVSDIFNNDFHPQYVSVSDELDTSAVLEDFYPLNGYEVIRVYNLALELEQ